MSSKSRITIKNHSIKNKNKGVEELQKRIEDDKKRKQDLLKRAKKNIKNRELNTSTVSPEEKEIKQLRKKLEQIEGKYTHSLKEVNKLNQEIGSLKEDISNRDRVITTLRKNKYDLELTVKDLEFKLKFRESEINQLSNRIELFDADEMEQLQKENLRLKADIKIMKDNTELNKEKLHQFKRWVIKEQKERFGDLERQNETLNRRIKVRDKEIIELKNKIQELHHNLNTRYNNLAINDLISALRIKMNVDNVGQFYSLYGLMNRYNALKKELQKKLEKERYHKKMMKNAKNMQLGYLAYENDWWFYSHDNELHKVVGSKPRELVHDFPARAIINDDGTAYVVWVYYDTNDDYMYRVDTNGALNKMVKKKSPTSDETEEKYMYIGDFKVLLVGSQRMNKYKERLEKHGLEVVLHDPFEEYERLVKTKAESADIVILFTSHMSHAMLDLVDRKDDKIQLMEKDNEDTVVARVRYAAIKLGLINLMEEK